MGADASGPRRPPVPILTGPTGAGKSDWALRAAERLPIEIVSMDSALVYRGLDIGAAKPSADIRARVPHHLIDIREPTQAYSAGEFVRDARRAIDDIFARGRAPLIVGGTMLYLRSLRSGMAALPLGSPEIRAELDARAAREGWPVLHGELTRVDPDAGARIHPNDPQRIQRALEVYLVTGRPISDWQREARSEGAALDARVWAVVPERVQLHRRVAARFEAMMAAGFLEEVRALRARGDLSPRDTAMRAVGYRQIWGHLDGEYALNVAIERGVAATRQLAKRQLTWLRSEPRVELLDPDFDEAFETWIKLLETSTFERGRGGAPVLRFWA